MIAYCLASLLSTQLLQGCVQAKPVAFDGEASADANHYLSEDFFPGMHLLDLDAGEPGSLVAYKGGQLPGVPEPVVQNLRPFLVKVPGTLPALLKILYSVLQIPELEELQNECAFFDRQGAQIKDVESLKRAKVAFLLEVGVWIWPAVRVGFQQEANDINGGKAILTTLSTRPKIFEVRNFISVNETEAVMDLGQKQGLVSSKGQMQSKDVAAGTADAAFRTSKQAWLHAGQSPVIKQLDERIAELTRVPESHQEPAQLLRYDEGKYYHNHMDWAELSLHDDQQDIWVRSHMGYQDRLATVFWYLNDVPEGGETNFPKQGQPICAPLSRGGPDHRHCPGTHDPPSNRCTVGMKVQPQRGTVIMWYNYHANARGDTNALHAGCPVGKGLVKWSANKWVRMKPVNAPGRWIENHPAIKRFKWKGADAPVNPDACTMYFHSEHADNAEIFWSGGEEASMGPLDPGTKRSMNSFRGHHFFLKAGSRRTELAECRPPHSTVRLTADFKLEWVTSRKEL